MLGHGHEQEHLEDPAYDPAYELCQEFIVPDDWTLVPRAHYHPFARFYGANNRSSSEGTVYFLQSGGLKII